MGARRLISGSRSKKLTGASEVEDIGQGVKSYGSSLRPDIGKQTRSDPMETVRPGKSRSESPEVSSRRSYKYL